MSVDGAEWEEEGTAVAPGAVSEVTLVVSRRARPGREAALERWISELVGRASTSPGQRGVTVLRPRVGQPEYVIVLRFASEGALTTWQGSTALADLLERVAPLVEAPATVQVATGLDAWFTLPGRVTPGPPPRWKMAVLTWIVITPLIVLVSALCAPLIGHLPFALRTALSGFIVVPMMTWVVMPTTTRVAWRWLYPSNGA